MLHEEDRQQTSSVFRYVGQRGWTALSKHSPNPYYTWYYTYGTTDDVNTNQSG